MNPLIVPLRNGYRLTLAAHRTFIAQDIPIELTYINNASTDGTREWLNSLDCYVIQHQVPKSVSASWNEGLSFWFQAGAEHCLVVNNDVLLRPDTYHLLLQNPGGFVTAVGNADPDCVKSNALPMVPPRPHPDFSCFLIRREVWDKVGPFDESYVGAYAEDANYHLRMHRAGITAVCIDLPFYHLGAGTLKSTDDKREKDAIVQSANANRARFKEQYGVEVGTPEYYELFGSTEP